MKKQFLFYGLLMALVAVLSTQAQPIAPTTGVKYRMLCNRSTNAFWGSRSSYRSTGTAYNGFFSTTLFQFVDQGSEYYAIQQASTGCYLNDRSNNGFGGSGGAMGYVASASTLIDFQMQNFI
jgi:hypothetical protein